MVTAAQQARQEARQEARMEELLRIERDLWQRGIKHVAGVDEVGVGPLAGPVVAAAVIVAPTMRIAAVDDSKKLSAPRREAVAARICAEALAVAIGVAEVDEIDRINIYQATLLAMRRAVEGLSVTPQHVVVDARTIPGISLPQTAFIKGDARSYSIAAASIVAKVHRDRLMHALGERHPEYGFARHMGYPTPQHLAALSRFGPCAVHRQSFAPVRQACLSGT